MYRRWIVRALLFYAGSVIAVTFGTDAVADEAKQIRIAKQYGISYLPIMVMEEKRLIEKHAREQGLGEVRTEWMQFSSGTAMNEALISGTLDMASGGVGPLVTIWAKTKGNLNVRGVAAINSMPLYLNTNNPSVKTIKDFTDKDRIALPAVKVSIQAVTLQMAAEKLLGKHDALDHLTVSMSHPDATAALLSGQSEITAHFGSPPFHYTQLENPKVKRVLTSFDVLGGPATFNTVWTSTRFRSQNPKLYRAFLDGLEEATTWINENKKDAAALYIKVERSKLSQEFVEKMLNDPENIFTTTPHGVMKYAGFMHKVGSIREMPSAWTEMFFPEVHGKSGS